MRNIFIILFLIVSFSSNSQLYFGRIASSSGSGGGGGSSSPDSVLFYDDFNGVSLSSGYKQRRPNLQTVSVSGGNLTIQGNHDTYVPPRPGFYGNYKNYMTRIWDTTYGASMIGEYTISTKVKFNDVTDTSARGFWLGAYSPFTFGEYNFSCGAYWDFVNDSLMIQSHTDSTYYFTPTTNTGSKLSATFHPNTSDWWILSFSVKPYGGIARIENLTTGDTISKTYYWDYLHPVTPSRPNYFHWSMAAINKTNVSLDYLKVTTPELRNRDIIFIGNSITRGYYGGHQDSSFARMLDAYTNSTIQIWAGGGQDVINIHKCIPELITYSPGTAIVGLATNNSYGSTERAAYQAFIDTLTAHGITSYKTLTPNGGNPVGGGSWNQWIKDTYPSTYIDTWTTGWNTMSTGNGEMEDSVHPSATGMRKLALIIKAALPSLFPL